jgi:hypothetical protein
MDNKSILTRYQIENVVTDEMTQIGRVVSVCSNAHGVHNAFPRNAFLGIWSADDVFIQCRQHQHVIGTEFDIGVNEDQPVCIGPQKFIDQIVACPLDQRFVEDEVESQFNTELCTCARQV